MRPERATQFNAWRDFDFSGRNGEHAEFGFDGTLGRIERWRQATIQAGKSKKPPKQPRQARDRCLTGTIIGAVLLGTLGKLLGRGAQNLEIACGRFRRAFLCLSIGVQKGPPIGVQKRPPSSSSVTGMTGAPFALVAA